MGDHLVIYEFAIKFIFQWVSKFIFDCLLINIFMSHSRRSFLRNTALAGMAMSVPFRNELLALAPGKKQFGIQLWSSRFEGMGPGYMIRAKGHMFPCYPDRPLCRALISAGRRN